MYVLEKSFNRVVKCDQTRFPKSVPNEALHVQCPIHGSVTPFYTLSDNS
jgi:hypothetical protein